MMMTFVLVAIVAALAAALLYFNPRGWRTRLVAVGVAVLGTLELYDPEMWASILPAEYQGLTAIAIGVAMYWLRQITTTPPGRSG
jgi:hypothetical protein